MFVCHFCNRSSLPNEKMRLVAVETRQRSYALGFQKEALGTEVVIEAAQCPRCAAGQPPIEAAPPAPAPAPVEEPPAPSS